MTLILSRLSLLSCVVCVLASLTCNYDRLTAIFGTIPAALSLLIRPRIEGFVVPFKPWFSFLCSNWRVWTTDHYHPSSNLGEGVSEICFIFDFASLPSEVKVARPI